MLPITIPEGEYYDSEKNEFITIKEQRLRLEHSLVSISKWEEKWKLPYLSTKLTTEQSKDYIRCMTLTQNVDPIVYQFIPNSIIEKVQKYIDDPMTATTIKKNPKPGPKKIITSEVVYFWMVTFNIPKEFEKWHFNRLLTLIEICNIENSPKKKMSKNSIYDRNRALNEANRLKSHSRG